MDIFRFQSPMSGGRIINGLSSKLWVERYALAGEFKLVAKAYPELRDLLPIGSFVSHTDTEEIMVVENHEISATKGKDTEITISGRGFETLTEGRIVGTNKTFPASGLLEDYQLGFGYTWEQIGALLREHLQEAYLVDDDNSFPNLEIQNEGIFPPPGEQMARSIKRENLYSSILALMAIDGVGIKVSRPGPWIPYWESGNHNSLMLIHRGVDRSDQIVFSTDTGEIESADYLWSNKKMKNMAYVHGKWVETMVTTTDQHFDRRMMEVDASDIDQIYNDAPTGTLLDQIVALMQQRGLQALASQNDVALSKVEISKSANLAKYRVDFNVGDIIGLHGDYNQDAVVRISEYVEIEDENGFTSYPTLAAV